MRLRQVVVAAGDLAATRASIEDALGLPHVWADPAWEVAPDRGYSGITGATFAVSSPSEVAARWAALLGTGADGHEVGLDGATLRFVSNGDGRSGLCEVIIAGATAATATIAGVDVTVA